MNYILVIVFLSVSAFSYLVTNDNANINKIDISISEIATPDRDIEVVPYPKKTKTTIIPAQSKELKNLKKQIKAEKKKARAAKEKMFQMQEDFSKMEDESNKPPPEPKLKTHKLKYKAYAKVGNNKYMAFGEYNGKKVYLTEGDVIDGSKVEQVTPKSIIIAGYKPVKNNYFIPYAVSATQNVDTDTREDMVVVSPRIRVLEENNKVKRQVDILNDESDEQSSALVEIQRGVKSEESLDVQEEDPTPEIKATPKKRMILRSFVSEVANNSRNINDYIYFSRTNDGYRITPKPGFENVFEKIGFQGGDEVIKVNSNHVFSSSAMMDLLNVTTAKKIKLLIKNGNRYRVVMINLLKVHEF
jgi:type II secretory pathway component PulC